jgi:pimeloyl-ACP methyl ester carboxylesterase
MAVPQSRYTSLGEADIAYQVLGEGPLDLVYANGLTEHIDLQWDHPLMARYLERLASVSRLILFDRRGAGASDPVPLDALPTWEEWTEDLRAVLDAVGSERAAIYAELDAGPVGMIFAATHPERTSALVLATRWHATPRRRTTRTGPPPRPWSRSWSCFGPPGAPSS